MNLDFYVERMSANRDVFASLVSGVGAEQARWRPAPGKWSLVEVVNHLYDEEREDFRTRLRIALDSPTDPWPPIDPAGWVAARDYNARDLQDSLRDFRRERDASLAWLRALDAPDWRRRTTHPRGHTLTAGDLLASWLAHDLLHVRQMTRLHWDYVDPDLRSARDGLRRPVAGRRQVTAAATPQSANILARPAPGRSAARPLTAAPRGGRQPGVKSEPVI